MSSMPSSQTGGSKAVQTHLLFVTTRWSMVLNAKNKAAPRLPEGAARVAVHRFRKRFREVFRQTIADTISAPDEVESELRLVLEILSDG
jgi:hypothetical protein